MTCCDMRIVLSPAFLLILIPMISWAQAAPSSSTFNEDHRQAQLLADGVRILASGKPKEAIAQYFEKVVASYEDQYRDTNVRLLCARSTQESLLYLLQSAKDNIATTVISATWADAYYYKAYALVELKQVPEAKTTLARALALSPSNSQYLSELGHIYQWERDWPMALQTFQAAEAAAHDVSPPQTREIELCRAWKGLGYVFVEQNRLAEAEKMYKQCLELKKDDSLAMRELRHIQGLKAKQRSETRD